MARFRNPRYAPESLERRLSPAFLIAAPAVAAEVMTLKAEPIRTPEVPDDQVPTDPSDTPPVMPMPPINPSQPS
jgi:hypothetical protein